MAGSPKLKVFNKAGEYVAACKHAEDAAMIIAGYGAVGSSIRVGHSKKYTVWLEGFEGQEAGDSYDHVAEVVALRRGFIQTHSAEWLARELKKPNDERRKGVKS